MVDLVGYSYLIAIVIALPVVKVAFAAHMNHKLVITAHYHHHQSSLCTLSTTYTINNSNSSRNLRSLVIYTTHVQLLDLHLHKQLLVEAFHLVTVQVQHSEGQGLLQRLMALESVAV
jgi:hypothetical protein